MKLIIQNDQSAFNELYTRYKTSVFTYLVRNADKTSAEELFQESFYKLLKNKDSFKFESKFKTWFWTLIRNNLIDHYRSNKKVAFVDLTNEEGEEVIASDDDFILDYQNKESAHLILEALNELNPTEKEIFLLAVESELSYEEISKMTSLKVANIKTIMFRTKTKLKDILTKRGSV